MTSEPGFYNKQIAQMDVDTYVAAVKSNDYREANIFANRMMSNSYLSNTKEYGIVGYILKEMSNDGALLQQATDKTLLTSFSKEASKAILQIVNLLKVHPIDLSQIWKIYADFVSKNRDIFMTKNEKMIYKKSDTTFTHLAIVELIKILDSHKNSLMYPSNNLLKGILNEIGRFIKNHTLDTNDIHYISLLIMLGRLDEYIKGTSVVNEFPDRVAKELLPMVNETINVYNQIEESSEKITMIDELLWKLIKIWRLYFIIFMEVGSGIQMREEKIAEEPIKSKLVDAITKEIEKEIGKE